MAATSHLTAIFDAIRRREPDRLRSLAAAFPEFVPELEPRRVLGEGDVAPQELGAEAASALVDIAAREARAELDEVLAVLAGRTRLLARIRVLTALISAISTAGLVALILGNTQRGQIAVSMIAFLSALLSLLSTYVEDFSGGDGSTRRLREAMTSQVRSLAESEGRGKLARITRDSKEVLATLVAINVVFAEAQYARSVLGMRVSST